MVVRLNIKCHDCICYIKTGIPSNFDILEGLFHVSRHSQGKDAYVLPDIFLERGASPATHFLDLHVRVSEEGKT